MASGLFVSFDKKQPGVYFNRRVMKRQTVNKAISGTVVYPMDSDWGPRGQIIEINSLQECFTKLGYYYNDDKMRPIVEMFRGSSRTQGANRVFVIIPEVATMVKATATIGAVTVTATYPGKKGNKIIIVITPDFDTEYDSTNHLYAVHRVQTIVDGLVVYTKSYGQFIDKDHYTAAKVSDLVDNEFVKWSYAEGDEDELITDTAGTNLAGGDNSDVTDAEYATVCDILDNKFFDILCYDKSSNVVKAAYNNFIQRQWENRGYYCQLVTSNFMIDFEGCISLQNGLVLSDGYTLDEMKATWWYAGCSAGARYNESLTHVQHPLAIDVTKEYTKDELDSFIDNGQVVFVKEFNIPMVNKDINTLHTFTPEKGQDLASNRLLRVMNEICNYCNYEYNINYIGNLYNDEDGRDILKGNITGKLNEMQANHGIQNFNADEDVQVNPIETDLEAVEMIIGVHGVGAIEKIYIRLTSN